MELGERYAAAAKKFTDAQWQYRMAESALARATAVLNTAERELDQVYWEMREDAKITRETVK